MIGSAGLPLRELQHLIKQLAIDGTRITLDLVFKQAKKLLENHDVIIENPEDIANIAKIAWNYREVNCVEYTFGRAVKWFKSNLPEGAIAACLLRRDSKIGIELHHCFLNSDGDPVLDGTFPHLVVRAFKIDDDLTSKLGNKELLVLN